MHKAYLGIDPRIARALHDLIGLDIGCRLSNGVYVACWGDINGKLFINSQYVSFYHVASASMLFDLGISNVDELVVYLYI